MEAPAKYRYRDLKPGDAYYEQWKRVTLTRIVRDFLLYGPAIAGLLLFRTIPEEKLGKPAAIIFLSVVGVCFGLFWGVIYQSTKAYRCPRCGERFERSLKEGASTGGVSCDSCGLPKWAPDDPEKGELVRNPVKRYRYRYLKRGDAYYEKWRMSLFKTVPLLPVAIYFFLFDAMSNFFPRPPLWGVMVGIPILFVLLLLSQVRCPRCNKGFYGQLSYFSWFVHTIVGPRKCANCDLPKWAPEDTGKGVFATETSEEHASRIYEFAALKSSDPYAAAWQSYSQRTSTALALTVVVICFTPLTWLLSGFYNDNIIRLSIWGVYLAFLMRAVWGWKCPRCGGAYVKLTGIFAELCAVPHGPAAKECVNCRLPRWSPDDPDKEKTG